MTTLSLGHITNCFMYCYSMSAFRNNDLSEKLATNESYFHHALLWPIIEMAVDSCGRRALNFIPGERILRTSEEEYKADGVVVRNDGLEILLLETLGSTR